MVISLHLCKHNGVSTAGLQSLFLPLDFCNVVQGFGLILFAQMELLYYLLHVSRCICGYLSSKPRILVTHQLQYLKEADQLLVLSEVSMSYFQFHNHFIGFWKCCTAVFCALMRYKKWYCRGKLSADYFMVAKKLKTDWLNHTCIKRRHEGQLKCVKN